MKTELNLMRSIYDKESDAPAGLVLPAFYIPGVARRAAALHPGLIALSAPPVPDADVQTQAVPPALNINV
jgi:hypothetical protein